MMIFLVRMLMTVAYAIMVSLIISAQVMEAAATAPPVQPASGDNALELLIIEMFFLIVGLIIVAIIGYLIWESWRRKKKMAKRGK